MIDISAERDRFYEAARGVLSANNASSFVDLSSTAREALMSKGVSEETIDKVLMAYAPYFRYWEFRGKEELLNKVIEGD